LFSAVLAEAPGWALALRNRGRARMGRGAVEAAIADFRLALAREPDSQLGRKMLTHAMRAEALAADRRAERPVAATDDARPAGLP
jgi:hypothetical protein